jgi:hypothetical protein
MGGGSVDGGRERWDVLLVSEGERQGWPPAGLCLDGAGGGKVTCEQR